MARQEDSGVFDAVDMLTELRLVIAEREQPKTRVDELIEKGCMQVSRKYRLVGFMPAGYGTALEALAALQPEVAAGLMRRYAASLEAHAKQEVCSTNTVELTPEEFNEYLSKTGRKPVALAPEDGKGCELCRTYTNNHRKDCPNGPK